MNEQEHFLHKLQEEWTPLPQEHSVQVEITKTLIKLGLYRKLSELINLRSTTATVFQFNSIADLRSRLEQRLASQKTDELAWIISAVKTASSQQVSPSDRSKIQRAICKEQALLSGIKCVYNAVLERQYEQARHNQAIINAETIRPEE